MKETLVPSPDGVVTSFFTSVVYRPGTVSVWLNGIKLIKGWDDGFMENGGREIVMNEAPLFGDSLQVEYEAQ